MAARRGWALARKRNGGRAAAERSEAMAQTRGASLRSKGDARGGWRGGMKQGGAVFLTRLL